ncbi:MAG: hypothetical protein GX221_11000 [Candidatus Riflebacteria bacterium]|nr:hypothetical protein [Candidatus Riflebacteria bacterium]
MGVSFPIFASSPFDVGYTEQTGTVTTESISGSQATEINKSASGIDNDAESELGTAVIDEDFLDNLTEEEMKFLQIGLLPDYYPQLKQCKEQKPPYMGAKGGIEASIELCKSFFPNVKPGQFSKNFGNMDYMLNWAREVQNDKALIEMIQACKVGDAVISGPNRPTVMEDDMICMLTKGPYFHATLITHVSPPVMIEAMGITGDSSDPTTDQVRMLM